VAGDEESKARHVLADMQLRISQGPTSALGIGEIVTPEEVRAAFLDLTKRFHPARFGRMSPDLQKLSNEVFLGIKAAHDHMLKVLGVATRSTTHARTTTGAIPIISADGTNRTPYASTTSRVGTPPLGVPQQPAARQTTGGMRAITPVPPATQPGVTPASNPAPAPVRQTTGGMRAVTPVPPGTQPGVAPGAQSSQRLPRMDSSGAPFNPPTQPPTNPPTGRGPVLPPRPAPDAFNPPTVRNIAVPPTQPIVRFGSPAPGSEQFDEAAAFREAAALMERKDWAAARQALHALAARVPQSKTYRAWLCYARGREAYLAGRPDDAILEMQRALQLEPDLAHAKHALAELQRRR
jgi:hypothetical protein